MSTVPLPVDLVMGALPLGFKGNLQEYANAIVDGISATVQGTFLTGQVGGNPPTSNIGPWANGNEWWFWDPGSGQYQPSDQGTPIGTMAMWGGTGIPGNGNWLLCDGRAIARGVYSRLYQAIGTTWGIGDGASTFNLPPGGKFFVNAPGFVADATCPIDSGYTGQGVNARGGKQTTTITAPNLPALEVIVPFIQRTLQFQSGSGSVNASLVLNDNQNGDGTNTYAVRTPQGVPLGGQNSPFTIMPPFCAVNFIIKAL